MTRTVTSAIPLLSLQHDDETKPLLPLSSSDPHAYENSPLASLRPLGVSPSEQVSQLLGPGPWPIRAKLYLPADCGVLHATSKSKDSAIHVTHSLRFTMRLARGDNAGVDSKTGKNKLYEVAVRTPVQILSVRPYPFLFLWEGLTCKFVRPTVLCARGVHGAAALLGDARRKHDAGAAGADLSVCGRARATRAQGRHAPGAWFHGRGEPGYRVPCAAVWGGAGRCVGEDAGVRAPCVWT